MKSLKLAASVASLILLGGVSAQAAPHIVQTPTTNGQVIVFSYGGDLWSVPFAGGNATRLTTSPGVEKEARFSPDGQTIAFTGNYDGNADVYTIPASGGVPQRKTFHPEQDIVSGWTRDGKQVLFASNHRQSSFAGALFTVGMDAGLPTRLPLPSGQMGSLSPDGSKIAYVPRFQVQVAWKRYRGGQTFPIWIANLADSSVIEIPRNNSNDFCPMWIGDDIYFLSDREGKVKLFKYETGSKRVSRVLDNTGFDFKSASAGPDCIVIDQFGGLVVYDLKTKSARNVEIKVAGDFPEVRSRFLDASPYISDFSLSPGAVRVAVTARGEVFTVPTGRGTTANITQTSGAADRDAAWSPDGKQIAYISDKSGDMALVLANATTGAEEKTITLGEGKAWFYDPIWSPTGKHIAYTDNKLNVWVLDVASGKSTKVDSHHFLAGSLAAPITPDWSPDGKYVTYNRQLSSRQNAVFCYDVESGKKIQITDGMSDAYSPTFDRSGKYLYFAASTDTGRASSWLDMSSIINPNTTASLYVVVLRNDTPSPLAIPDEQEGEAPASGQQEAPGVRIDEAGLSQRILALPVPARPYSRLAAGPPGTVFVQESGPMATIATAPGLVSLYRFDFMSRQLIPFARGVQGFTLSSNGQKILIFAGGQPVVVPTAAPSQPGQGALNLSGLQMKLDPRAEWRQIFREGIRIQRDFFYAPNYHGVDLAALERQYEPFMENLVTREELNILFEDMLGELCIGHMFIFGGDIPGVGAPGAGSLGADYEIVQNRYRFARVFDGENWNPNLRAPLTGPGATVTSGEFLIAVNGVELTGRDNVHERLLGTAGRHVRLKVAKTADGANAREVTVIPIGGDQGLRLMSWVEDCRRTVDRLSKGRLGYAYIPDTGVGGFTFFNRYFQAAIGKEGIILDERNNGGGFVADYIVDILRRPLASMWTGRDGADFASPGYAIRGPKVMITDELAGSGGDYLPYLFRFHQIGQIVGKRTWGALVGIGGTPSFVDGGAVTSPNFAFYRPDGKWDIENFGTPPDFDVELDPAMWRQGRDAQLEKAVEVAMKELEKNPQTPVKRPAWPNKQKIGGTSSTR